MVHYETKFWRSLNNHWNFIHALDIYKWLLWRGVFRICYMVIKSDNVIAWVIFISRNAISFVVSENLERYLWNFIVLSEDRHAWKCIYIYIHVYNTYIHKYVYVIFVYICAYLYINILISICLSIYLLNFNNINEMSVTEQVM